MNSEGIEAIIEANLSRPKVSSDEGLTLSRYLRARLHNAKTKNSLWTREHAHLAAEKELSRSYIHIDSLSSLHSVHLAVEFFRINPELKSIHLPTRYTAKVTAMTTQQDPTPEKPFNLEDELVATIVAKPDMYAVGMVAVAKAYESQRERIADLEDDVDRLRTRKPFVPEVLFECEADGVELQLETQCRGGLTVTHRGDDGDYRSVLTALEATQLTTALLKWTGTGDSVEWRSVDDPPDGHLDQVLLMDDRNDNRSNVCSWHKVKGEGGWPFIMKPTHWAPLPKFPKVSK